MRSILRKSAPSLFHFFLNFSSLADYENGIEFPVGVNMLSCRLRTIELSMNPNVVDYRESLFAIIRIMTAPRSRRQPCNFSIYTKVGYTMTLL